MTKVAHTTISFNSDSELISVLTLTNGTTVCLSYRKEYHNCVGSHMPVNINNTQTCPFCNSHLHISNNTIQCLNIKCDARSDLIISKWLNELDLSLGDRSNINKLNISDIIGKSFEEIISNNKLNKSTQKTIVSKLKIASMDSLLAMLQISCEFKQSANSIILNCVYINDIISDVNHSEAAASNNAAAAIRLSLKLNSGFVNYLMSLGR